MSPANQIVCMIGGLPLRTIDVLIGFGVLVLLLLLTIAIAVARSVRAVLASPLPYNRNAVGVVAVLSEQHRPWRSR